MLAIAPTADRIDRPIMRDPIQPGRDRPAAILIAMKPLQHAQKDFGLEILGQLGFADPKIDVAIDRRRIALVDLRERAKDPVRVYSYGMRQRLGIAQALLPAPEFIILDEPTNGLDPQGIQETRQLIRRLRDEFGLTVLLSSHLLTEVEQLCNRVGIIHEGRLLYEGGPDALVTPSRRYKVRVDNSTAAIELLHREQGVTVSQNGDAFLQVNADSERIPTLNALLVAHGIKVYELTPSQESLEEAFLRLTTDA